MLSRTVRWGNSPPCWITYPIVRRNWTGSELRTSVRSISTVPDVASTNRLIMRSDVVLPHPDEPTKTVTSPVAQDNERDPRQQGSHPCTAS